MRMALVTKRQESKMQKYTTGLSLEEQIGQVLAVGFYGLSVPPEVRALIQQQHVGNIILFSRNVRDPEQLRALTGQLQAIAREARQRYPLLIMLDQENGMVRRLDEGTTIFPGSMTLGAVGSEQVVYDVAQACGRELKALGVNMNLAPVVDVNNNPANPVIGVRSFGEDPQLVARLGAAAVRGYRAAGIITSIKHFPGHGDTSVDSHLALPVVPFDLQRLEQIELAPFRSGIEAGAASVMIAHMYLPNLMKQEMRPSTISPEIVQGLLREHLGYDGMVISDCLEMEAVASTVGTERGAVLALQAGVDLALISHHYERQSGAIAAIKQALQAGTIGPEVISGAAERVLKLKAEYLSWDDAPLDRSVLASPAHRQLSKQAYESAITLVKDEAGLLPLHLTPEQSLLVLFPRPLAYTKVTDRNHPDATFARYIHQRHANVEVLTPTVDDTAAAQTALQQALRRAAMTIVFTVNANLDLWQAEFVQQLLKAGRPLINVATYNPYDLLAYPQIGSYLASYEDTAPAFEAVARVLFGEIPARGRLPVSLPGYYSLVR